MNFNYSKDGITVAAMLDTGHPRDGGRFSVRVRVTYRRNRKYYPTGKALTPEEWDALPTTRSRALLDVRADIENSYSIVLAAAKAIAYTGNFSLEALNERLKGAASDTLNTMFKAKIDELRKSGRIGTMLVYDNVLKGVERFAGKNVLLEAVTTNWVRRYADFLRNEGKAQTTISINLRHLRALLNDAKRLGVLKESQYPFGRGRYEIQAGEGRKLALSQEQIATIAKYDDGTQATAKYRDYWLFLYLCNGINVADFVKLKYNNISDGEIHFVRQKTEFTTKTRKEISVVITQPMQTIIDRWGNTPATPNTYIFPVLDGSEDAIRRKQKTQYFTRAFNRRMAEVGERLNIGRISTYTARHSFATVLKRSGANISYISESLGHQDLKTTENYLASFEKEERTKWEEILTKFE